MNTLSDAALRALGASRQNNRLLRLQFPNQDGPAALMLANRLDAVESLSRDFHFTVEVISDDPAISLKDVQGKMVTVELVREDRSRRFFNGYVFEFRRVRADGGAVYYDMVLLPWLAYLHLRRDNYLFHNKTVRDQTDEIFADCPLRASELHIAGADPVMTDACQYDESDYNYLHRRWEQMGWHYWYEHSATGHTLMLSDDTTLAKPIDGESCAIPFKRHAGAKEDDGISDWCAVRRLMPASVVLASFDFKQPRPKVIDLPTINRQGDVLKEEVYEYTGAYGFRDNADGDAQTRLRLEEIEAGGKYFEGAGNDRFTQAGRYFGLTGHFDHPESAAGPETFLILDVRHTASNNYQLGAEAPSHYENRLSCSRKAVPWRPGRGYNSTQPKIYGLQTALVVGPPGEEIHTDQYGRVRVQFHWDRVGQYDTKSSAWVRVATAWSGAGFGMSTIPRVGTECVVQFLDGNPDRPLITGMVPNADTMPPWALPANKTQSGILSRSTPGGGHQNANAIRFEDKKGFEQLWMQAERNMDAVVKHNDSQSVGQDRTISVGGSHTESIGGDMGQSVAGFHTVTVKKDMTLSVTEGRQDSTVKGDISITSQNGEITLTSPTKITLTVGGSSITMTAADITIVGDNIFLNP
ncbi:MAG: type VI secretion system tip protein TssI/VgrG [Pseudomonadota bacterium]